MKRTFLEVGAGKWSALGRLLYPNWRSEFVGSNKLPSEIIGSDIEAWDGIFVEPCPENFINLREHLADAEGDAQFILGAVSDDHILKKMDVYTLDVCKDHPMGSFVFYESCTLPKEHNYAFSLFTITLDCLIINLGITPTLMHIDVEGEERKILENYTWNWKPEYLQIDMHGNQNNIKYAVVRLEALGYKILTTHGGSDNLELWAELEISAEGS